MHEMVNFRSEIDINPSNIKNSSILPNFTLETGLYFAEANED